MLRDAFFKGLRDLRRSLPWWAIGIGIWPLWMGAVYPSMRENAADMEDYIESMPDAFKNMFMGEASFSTPIGFVDAELMSMMSPLLFLIFAIGLATRQIAGEEESGSLSLLLSYPLSRTRLLTQKLGVLLVGVLAITVVEIVAMLLMIEIGDMGRGEFALDTVTVLKGHVYLGLLTLAVALVTFAAGAATGRRGLTIGVGAAVGAGSYLLNALAPLSDSVDFLQKVSLFYYAGGAEPLAIPLRPGYLAVLLGTTLVAAGVAFVTFGRRDVRV